MNTNKNLMETLGHSKIYQDYERALSAATGLPLSLRPLEAWQLSHHRNKQQNSFCALMAQNSRSCAACLQVQRQLSDDHQSEPRTATCFAGLSDTAVPVRTGNEVIGFLQTGQSFQRRPSAQQFGRAAKQIMDLGLKLDMKPLEAAYFSTRVLPPKQYESIVHLLSIFAEHLSMVSNQIVVQQESTEPVAITRAKQFIHAHHSDDLSLAQVAKAVNTSSFYFCKMFKKSTGIKFTDYVSRVRIEKAKNLLLNLNLRISEIAYEVGFQSLTHFNRIFRKVVGQSPTEFRDKLPAI